jgi:hypothetical protein
MKRQVRNSFSMEHPGRTDQSVWAMGLMLLLLLGVVVGIPFWSQATDDALSRCEAIYGERMTPNRGYEAALCYRSYLQSGAYAAQTPLEKGRIREDATEVYAWVSLNAGQAERANGRAWGAETARMLSADASPFALGASYWSAVFQSFSCQVADAGRTIPRCFMGARKDIQAKLEQARSKRPETHGYGPSRVLGIMLRAMPRIVGGNDAEGLRLLREAYQKAPNFSRNAVELGRALYQSGNAPEGRIVLEKLYYSSCTEMDPKRTPDCIKDQEEARQIVVNYGR